MEQSFRFNHRNEQVNQPTTTWLPVDGNKLELRELENRLRYGLEKCRIKDMTKISERMRRTEERIGQYDEEDRKNEAEQERRYLNELRQLQVLQENISVKYAAHLSKEIRNLELNELEDRMKNILENYKMKDMEQLTERLRRAEKRIEQYEEEERQDAAEQEIKYLRDLEQLQKITEEIIFRRSNESTPKNQAIGIEATMQLKLKNLRADICCMPYCAEKTTMKILAYCQQKLLRENIDEDTFDFISQNFKELQGQIEKEELLSELIRLSLEDLNRFLHNEDWSSAARMLSKILVEIRPLYVQEIQRLIKTTSEAAEFIRNKNIILLVGATGSGKSTTIQYLTGTRMKKIGVEIAPGRFLEHITVDGPVRNPGLRNITSSPFSRSETRFLIPVTISLKDVLGSHHTGDIILCDTPGFGDTAGPEVDIANSIGIIDAIKNCTGVKILALLCYTSIGDRGDGVEKLARILIQMIDRIEDRLDSISYAFTKCPSSTDIHPILCSFKESRVDADPVLQSDSALVAVLTDMVKKTEKSINKIDPIHSDPKILIKELNSLKSIGYPDEVLQCSLARNTQCVISSHAQRYHSSIMCAMTRKDIDLVMYYMNSLKFLSDLTKEHSVQDAYDKSVRYVRNDIEQYFAKIIENFNRYLTSQDGLRDEDILEYKMAHDYLQQIQSLKEHFGSEIVSADILIKNILSTLEKQNLALQKEELDNSAIRIFLDNFFRLKNSMKELQSSYQKICQEFTQCFQSTLVEPIFTLIKSNEFKQVGDRLRTISRCIPILNHHINGNVEEVYRDIVNRILGHLNSFSDEANTVLSKFALNDKDIEILQSYITSLKSAKIDISIEATKNLDTLHDEFINKVIQYFENIHLRIKGILDKSGNHTLETITPLVIQMEMILVLPDVSSKVARIFHHTIQDIHVYMQQLQKEIEALFSTLESRSGIVSFQPLARSLSRLKQNQWIDRIIPQAFDSLIHNLREELVETAKQLENRLKKLELNLRYPQNILLVKEILEKIESMKILEPIIPELKDYRDTMNKYLLDTTKEIFDSIQRTFNLAEKTIHPLREELIQLEDIKKECDQLNHARVFLRESGYSDIDVLNHRIEDLKQCQVKLVETEKAKQKIKSQLNGSSQPMLYSRRLTPPMINRGIFHQILGKISNRFHRSTSYQNESTDDEIVDDTTASLQEELVRLQSINEKYNSLLAVRQSIYPSETDFLRTKGQISYEHLEKTIDEKKRILNEYKQYRQTHYFSNNLDASLANNALIYISNSEKLGHHEVQEMTASMNDILRKYLDAYSDFLDKEMEKSFKHISRIDENNRTPYCNDLEKYLEEWFSFKKYTLVFVSLHGDEKINRWSQTILNYYHSLENEMEKSKISGENQELQNFLKIAQALSCIDRFWTSKPEENNFRALYRHYQTEITQASRQVQETVIDFISKNDFANADLALSDVVSSLSNFRLNNRIKHDLHCSLNKMIRETKSCAHLLDGKIELQEDHREKFQQITDTVEKIDIVLCRSGIMELLDESTKILLRNFKTELDRILSTAILSGLKNIEMFIDGNHFLEAEQRMKNLLHAHRELVDHYTSKVVKTKINEIGKRLSTLPNDILQGYNFTDLSNYVRNPPTDILSQLKRAISGGYPRYSHVYSSFIEQIRLNFTLVIDRVRENPLNDPSIQINSIQKAFRFLPEELKLMLQLQVDQLNQLKRHENISVEFD